MIKHVVLYKLKKEHLDKKQELVDMFLSMRGKIKELISIESGVDMLFSDRSFDVCLITEFKNMKDFNIYQTHEHHIPVLAFAKNIVEVSKSVDYEY